MVFSTLLTIGQLIFAIGGGSQSYGTMVLGRVVFGLGGECMTVAQSSIISQWFKGRELALAFGFNLSVSRLGSVFNGLVEPAVARDYGIGTALYVGFGVCCFSWVCGLMLVLVDSYADRKDGRVAGLSETEKFKCSHIFAFTLPFWLIVVSCVSVYCSIFPYSWNTATMLTT
jgi:MFS family permease